jgi:hypothetical protein
VGLVIGSELVNPDAVTVSLHSNWMATTNSFYPLGVCVCVSDIRCCCQLLRFRRVGQRYMKAMSD